MRRCRSGLSALASVAIEHVVEDPIQVERNEWLDEHYERAVLGGRIYVKLPSGGTLGPRRSDRSTLEPELAMAMQSDGIGVVHWPD